MKRKTILILLAACLTACSKENSQSAPSLSAVLESESILEYERPVINVSVEGETDRAFYPGQVIVDGTPVTVLNAAATTLYAGRTCRIALPRLAPGPHGIELVVGQARRRYRDAEAACGECAASVFLHLDVVADSKAVIVLTKPRTDQDDYFFVPEDGTCYDALTGAVDDVRVRPGLYTVQVCPSSLRSDGFSITDVGSLLAVERKQTAIGDGIEVTATSPLKPGDPAAQFTLSAGGYSITLDVE